MYSPAPASMDAYAPWRKHTAWTARVHETRGPENHAHENHGPENHAHENHGPENHGAQNHAHGHGGRGHEHRGHLHCVAAGGAAMPPGAVQHAPPLAAYSPAQCGPSEAVAEYSRAVQRAAWGGGRDVAVLLPRVLARLDTLRRLRATGHATLAPVGVHRTMRELAEEACLAAADDAPGGHAENLVASHAGDALGLAAAGSPLGAGDALPPNTLAPANTLAPGLAAMGVLFPDVDLDAGVPDADLDLDAGVPDADLDVGSDAGPAAYMAADVEYQHDHSLWPASGAATSASVSTGSVLPAPSAATRPSSTLAPPSRACDDSDVDMTLE
ncbi:hypothetical protein METBIDRAFT_9837 [Metschnikowia bicuspidata var. bicuspidata NRRL YB-4993]|uniref:Uncharacterized protein n=1 Tax=Metschnikowia bicuspidata var. bicuspidata NRRL YB-4993 TaxID=869754 RepID=A0A1A0HHV4_9ASCO|nr:hypothetical protein METBIDRAFT_9837 [Metschnikowia bicuspidata var. bicuspidata NRRL YB-4993]OBA23590.1 hypothetical protein METBIDRAFT_9837 [Metschnikowia bicuspidata var. bicuspidata NRRL YB-4993]